jgi:hypothetical protein
VLWTRHSAIHPIAEVREGERKIDTMSKRAVEDYDEEDYVALSSEELESGEMAEPSQTASRKSRSTPLTPYQLAGSVSTDQVMVDSRWRKAETAIMREDDEEEDEEDGEDEDIEVDETEEKTQQRLADKAEKRRADNAKRSSDAAWEFARSVEPLLSDSSKQQVHYVFSALTREEVQTAFLAVLEIIALFREVVFDPANHPSGKKTNKTKERVKEVMAMCMAIIGGAYIWTRHPPEKMIRIPPGIQSSKLDKNILMGTLEKVSLGILDQIWFRKGGQLSAPACVFTALMARLANHEAYGAYIPKDFLKAWTGVSWSYRQNHNSRLKHVRVMWQALPALTFREFFDRLRVKFGRVTNDIFGGRHISRGNEGYVSSVMLYRGIPQFEEEQIDRSLLDLKCVSKEVEFVRDHLRHITTLPEQHEELAAPAAPAEPARPKKKQKTQAAGSGIDKDLTTLRIDFEVFKDDVSRDLQGLKKQNAKMLAMLTQLMQRRSEYDEEI